MLSTIFFDAVYGNGLTTSVVSGEPNNQRAMPFFNEAVDWYSGYTDDAKHAAFFVFGRAVHLVEDMMTPAHVHNDAENALFVPVLCCGQLKNTHVLAYTLRFLKHPRLVLKQTGSFSGVIV